MKLVVRQQAGKLGFDDCRFTTVAPPESAASFLKWLSSSRHGTMTWLERNSEKRVDPLKVLPGACSIITLASSYAILEPPLPSAVPGQGVVARYAAYSDYHDVLAEKLKALSDFVRALGGTETRALWYVDTGPLLERDLAQRAGLGFAGKHTNLISRRLGNWFFISEIITNLALEADAPEKNRCGTCDRCITACPTGAITAPFQLDARRCISYLTIELKGSIPLEFRTAIGNRIFGCDDCLAACPWNRFAREGALMRAHARADLQNPDLLSLLALDEAQFKRQFTATPILRAKRRGLLRNVCVALGNTAGPEAIPALEQAARDPEPLIAEHALWALGQIRARQAANPQTQSAPSHSETLASS